jgi:glycylpeptide N-tetradecanoyltransferase
MVEINFLCVHKKLRAKRLAPVLIKEITRRVNLTNTWQAVYTAGRVLPKPVASCQYFHRTLNPAKLVAVKFTHLPPRQSMAMMKRLYSLPEVGVVVMVDGGRSAKPLLFFVCVLTLLVCWCIFLFDLYPLFRTR